MDVRVKLEQINPLERYGHPFLWKDRMKNETERSNKNNNIVQETSVAQDIVFEDDGRTTTGRVVAVAGDTVDITKNGLKINGAEQISQDIYFDTTQFKDGVDFPVTVGNGQVFILGDNRPQASDSRIYGCIDIKDVKGKVIAIIRSRGI